MKFVHNISIRVFCKADESEEDIRLGILKIINFSFSELEDQKLFIEESVVQGFDDKIKVFNLFIEKTRHINRVISNLNEKLSGKDKERLVLQDNRLDDNLNFFFRLSKPLILEDSFELTDSGDCYHVRFSVASFPKNKETALEKIKLIFS